MTDLRVGLIGYGVAGAFFHAPLIAATPGLSLSAVVTGNPGRAAEVREKYGARAVGDAAELWDSSDLIVVASPNRTHVPLAEAALKAGLPVVVDKPLAATAAQARALVRLAGELGLMLTVFQNRRWDGDFLTAERLVSSGELGTVSRLESRFERWRPIPKGGWRELGGAEEIGGLLYDLGSHLVDQALRLLGPVTHVYAESDIRRPGVASDDDTFIALTHAGGARSHLWAGAVAPRLGPRFRILGSEAGYVKHGLDVQEDRLRAGLTPDSPGFGEEPRERWGTLGTDEANHPVRTEPGAYADFYRAVAASLRDGAPPPVDPAEVIEALTVLEAARRSAAEHRVVAL
ncbi:Gfo/Idh/MocA family oxidoreductase [Streptosporangium roseum]|uniref:Oxidoreductase YdgJ n=1 Tax=Streptosporangium roseum (strain ATCC 12428 / DSM 43021 / JCM 3005 / KCTC 9067 / NCIMB 10171 / NRRL 2505 / NI 9100) TaxID=479432 RepID=D2B750_STRRD|nr:Gfo/Idh/MocA family oxidoreductase [Streptosporangium roseum]ACZ89575.1 oxidoreductase YdgJ [Streptosporangium roseum DSM 43021]